MSLLEIMRGTLSSRASSANFLNGEDVFDITLGDRTAGVRVDTDTAGQLSAVYASWRIVSEAVATLPRDSMRRINGVPKPWRPKPTWLDTPNFDDTWVDFIGQVMVSLMASGNAYILVRWEHVNGICTVAELIPMDPTLCRHVERDIIEVRNPDTGQITNLREVTKAYCGTGKRRDPMEVLHIRGMTKPGKREGLSPITACAETFGVSLAAQRYGASFFNNDGTPGGIIEVPAEARLSPAGQESLRQGWKDLFGGPNRAKNVAVLTEGAKFRALQISPNEAQFLETRKFGVQEIARIYGIPPHLLSDTTNTTGWGTGMAEQNNAFVIHTLRPWMERLEARFSLLLEIEVRQQMANPNANPGVYVHLEEEALLRGATTERWSNLRANVASGLMTADEARRLEGMDPLPDGLGAVPWIPLAQAPQADTPTPEEEEAPTPEGEAEGEADE